MTPPGRWGFTTPHMAGLRTTVPYFPQCRATATWSSERKMIWYYHPTLGFLRRVQKIGVLRRISSTLAETGILATRSRASPRHSLWKRLFGVYISRARNRTLFAAKSALLLLLRQRSPYHLFSFRSSNALTGKNKMWGAQNQGQTSHSFLSPARSAPFFVFSSMGADASVLWSLVPTPRSWSSSVTPSIHSVIHSLIRLISPYHHGHLHSSIFRFSTLRSVGETGVHSISQHQAGDVS
ncbi:hypothetical protein F5Y14DRAFT_61717 [Nemania sp. NC0429]|nr:hypothetical protein F5Y14DRAFT_61717 [Nemania sp. NC0429]